MTHVSNLVPNSALERLSPYEASTGKAPNLSHFRVLGSTVYVFIHEKERKAKSAKGEPRGKRGILVGYDAYNLSSLFSKG